MFSPAHSSLAQMSSAMIRGFGPISARMLVGVASARAGSNRRGIHSHSWQSRKKALDEVRNPAFICGLTGAPSRLVTTEVRWMYSPTCMRSIAATQAAQVWRVHWPGSVISGCSAVSQRPALAIAPRTMPRVLGVKVEVACQRSTQSAQVFAVPSMVGTLPCAGDGGGSQKPSDATAFWMPNSAAACERASSGCSRSRSKTPVVRSSRRGLRLSSRARHRAGGSRWSLARPIRYPHPPRTSAIRFTASSMSSLPYTRRASGTLSKLPMLRNAVNPPTMQA
jgi:hypothetical protein